MQNTVERKKEKENKAFFLIAAVLFKLVLAFAYIEFIVPLFEYEGYSIKYDLFKRIESWLIYIPLIVATPKILTKPSDFLMVFLLFTFLTPLLVFYGLSGADRGALYIVFMSVLLIYVFRLGPVFGLKNLKDGVGLSYFILIFGVIIVTAWMVKSGGLNFFNLDFTLVYDFRDDVGELIDKGVMGYLNVWASKVFGPVLLALALWKKKYLLAGFFIGLHLFWFGVSSHKSIIVYPMLIVFIWFWFARTKTLSLIPFALFILVVALLLYYYIFDEIFLPSMFIRRVFFVPAKLTFDYYEFFSVHPFVYWSNSIAAPFLQYPYSTNTALLIGGYLGDDTTAANNSFLSTGYMHAGVFGMFIYGLLVGLMFKLIDNLSSKHMPVWIAVAVVIIPSQALLTSADLPTSLLTHGFGVSMVLLYMLRSKNYFKN
ncbi:hypothetical protein [Limnohabitans sp. 2KL-3]|uniref:hypothetical protein n=1 Tax=Limnohabitans sp. 2KL-3 TaxID=1100700 RepID=UPI000B247A09|nr:hypothetical protein [Limnohabitans sp. 2KL-3]